LSDEFDDDYYDFLERIKKLLKMDKGVFDVDFLFLPEPNFDPNLNLQHKKVEGFKVTYHFEPGMEKPKIKIEGDFDEKKLQEYFKRLNLSSSPQFKMLRKSGKKPVMDLRTLSLKPDFEREDFLEKEPYYELNVYDDYAEIVIELPGIEKGHVILSLSKDGRKLKILTESNFQNFEKELQLPFESTMKDHVVEINNGIVTIIMRKINKQV
jgi:HSP20 family molecular chaperone IbpA